MAAKLTEENKRKLMVSILKFLNEEIRSESYDSENIEGLEVAIQCLENVFNVNENSSDEPSLSTIYSHFNRNNVLLIPDPCEEHKLEAENLKIQGNTCMTNNKFGEAISYYTRALELNPKNPIFYCNRAAAYSRINNHHSAIRDCEVAIDIDGAYSKAYGRLGLAYTGLENYSRAKSCYEIALSLDPKNESYLNNLHMAEKKLDEKNTPSSSKINGGNTNDPGGGDSSSGNVLNFNEILQNPNLMNFASQMLVDPSMLETMQSIMTGSLNDQSNMTALLSAGQHLAEILRTQNPSLIAELRRLIDNETMGPATTPNQSSNDTNPDGSNGNGCNKKQPSNRKKST